MAALANYLFAALIGAAAGGVELLRRYRDAPWSTLGATPAVFYVVFNGLMSLLAFHLVLVFDVHFGIDPKFPERLATVQVLAAGLAAVAFFRTTLFTAKVGDTSIEIGPSAVLQVLLSVTDRTIDRSRATPRAHEVPKIMDGIDFDKAAKALPAFCFGVMQNIGAAEQEAARIEVERLAADLTLSKPLKRSLLGLLLVNLVGKTVLESAVEALGDEIRAPLDDFDFDLAKISLPALCFATAQNIGSEEQTAVHQQISTLEASSLSNDLKSRFLGLLLVNLVGRAAVARAIRSLGAKIGASASLTMPLPTPSSPPPRGPAPSPAN